jgi:hypothetical protein
MARRRCDVRSNFDSDEDNAIAFASGAAECDQAIDGAFADTARTEAPAAAAQLERGDAQEANE